ncbi:DUF927 domain-containing protein [Roseovarius aestuarii]|nr:DUF927 domain-containing protein [Roseovarius aestuarii]
MKHERDKAVFRSNRSRRLKMNEDNNGPDDCDLQISEDDNVEDRDVPDDFKDPDELGAPEPFELYPEGLFKAIAGPTPMDDISVPVGDWIQVAAKTRQPNGHGYGLLVEHISADGELRETVIESRRLEESPRRVVGDLVDKGYQLYRRKDASNDLISALSQWKVDRWVLVSDRRGWLNERTYICSDGKALGDDAKYIAFDDEKDDQLRGTLEQWRETIGARAIGNPLIVLGLSAAFASVLIEPLEQENAGLHFVGMSGTGKTTIMQVFASVHGSPKSVRSWHTTGAALEVTALASNGMAMCLDELGMVQAKVAETMAYALMNGCGKSRSGFNVQTANTHVWKLVLISNGEVTLKEKLASEGVKINLGQIVRVLDIPTDGQQYGVFGDLHGAPDGRIFSDELKASAARNHGVAGPAFVKGILEDRDEVLQYARDVMLRCRDMARTRYPQIQSNLQERALTRFCVFAAGGELASRFGITGWPPDEALNASLELYGSWLELQKPEAELEAEESVTRMRAFLRKNESRIQDLADGAPAVATPIGWRNGEHIYLSRGAWMQAHAQHNARTAVHALAAYGFLTFGEGRNAMSKAPKGAGIARGYKISMRILRPDMTASEPYD